MSTGILLQEAFRAALNGGVAAGWLVVSDVMEDGLLWHELLSGARYAAFAGAITGNVIVSSKGMSRKIQDAAVVAVFALMLSDIALWFLSGRPGWPILFLAFSNLAGGMFAGVIIGILGDLAARLSAGDLAVSRDRFRAAIGTAAVVILVSVSVAFAAFFLFINQRTSHLVLTATDWHTIRLRFAPGTGSANTPVVMPVAFSQVQFFLPKDTSTFPVYLRGSETGFSVNVSLHGTVGAPRPVEQVLRTMVPPGTIATHGRDLNPRIVSSAEEPLRGWVFLPRDSRILISRDPRYLPRLPYIQDALGRKPPRRFVLRFGASVRLLVRTNNPLLLLPNQVLDVAAEERGWSIDLPERPAALWIPAEGGACCRGPRVVIALDDVASPKELEMDNIARGIAFMTTDAYPSFNLDPPPLLNLLELERVSGKLTLGTKQYELPEGSNIVLRGDQLALRQNTDGVSVDGWTRYASLNGTVVSDSWGDSLPGEAKGALIAAVITSLALGGWKWIKTWWQST